MWCLGGGGGGAAADREREVLVLRVITYINFNVFMSEKRRWLISTTLL